MQRHSKQMTEQHVIDGEAQDLLRSILPKNWVLRHYRPDYGLDFALEVFREIPGHDRHGAKGSFETLGEHIFLQLKGARKADRRSLKVYSRGNVEKMLHQENRKDLVGEIETLPFAIETSELLTVQRMGAALPVLLIRADLQAGKCYFVCLNDYIDKILVPRHTDYTKKASSTIHVPGLNDLRHPQTGITSLRWYAKRAKLFAGFQKFVYQQVELSYITDRRELMRLAKHFASLSSVIAQNRPLVITSKPANGRSVRDIDSVAKPSRLARHEQCLERRKTTTSHSAWAARMVAAAHRAADRCTP